MWVDVLIEETDGFVSVSLRPVSSNNDPEGTVGSFCNEVLDQELREELSITLFAQAPPSADTFSSQTAPGQNYRSYPILAVQQGSNTFL